MSRNNPNITFFIGNGFDIAMNMKTSYPDYVKWYCDNEDPLKEKRYISYLKKRIAVSGRANSWGDCMLDLNEYPDFTSKSRFKKEEYQDFCKHFLFRLPTFLNQRYEECEAYLSSLTEEYFDNIRDIFMHFADYLNKEELSYLMQEYAVFNNPVPEDFRFVNFNYTGVADEVLQKIFTNPIITHAHGKFYKEEPEESIRREILLCCTGNMSSPFIYTDSIQPSDEMQAELNKEIRETMASSQFICIYGMAIGVTDGSWWHEILKWLGSETHELFIYWYKDKGIRENRYLQDMILERLFGHSEHALDDAEKSILSKRIHILYIDQNTFKPGKKSDC